MERAEAAETRRRRARARARRARPSAIAAARGRARRGARPTSTARPPRSAPRAPTVVAEVGDDLVALYEKIRAQQRRHSAPPRCASAAAAGASSSSTTVEIQRIRAAPDDEVLRCEECRRILVRTAESGCEPCLRADRLIVEADGGSRGNPGVAGYGALVRDADTGARARRARRAARQGVQQRRGVLRADRRARGGARDRPRRRGRRADGLQARRRADVRALEDQARGHAPARARGPRPRAAQITRAGGSVRFEWIPRDREQGRRRPVQRRDGRPGRRPHARRAPSDVDDVPGEPEARRGAEPAPHRRPTGGARPTRVVLVRHGVTDFTAQGRLDGRGGADPSAQRHRAGPGGRRRAGRGQPGAGSPRPGWSRRRWPGRWRPARPWPQPSAPTRWSTPSWDEQSFGDWDGRSIEDLVAGERDAHAGAARRPGLPPARRRVARRPRRAGRAGVRAGGRRGRHQRGGVPPQADHRRARAPARASRTTGAGGSPRPRAR